MSSSRLYSERPADELVMICLFCDALVFSHLREAFQCEGRGSASLWGIFSTGQQVHDSLTRALHQLWVCVSLSMSRANSRQPDLWENWPSLANRLLESKAAICYLSLQLWKAVCVQLVAKSKEDFFCFSTGKKRAFWIDRAFHTVLFVLAFNSRRTVFTNWCSAPLGL